MSMITATTWVPRGHAAAFPTKYIFDDEEYGRIAKLAKLQLEDAEQDLAEAKAAGNGESSSKSSKGAAGGISQLQLNEDADDDLKEYDLEHYDDDDDQNGQSESTMAMFGNPKSLAYHESNAEDPYITLGGDDDEDDEDREELQILATDNLLLAARIEDEVAHLEVYVYEDEADNLYVHHDIMLPAYPLCVEWINSHPGKAAVDYPDANTNFAAIGTMDPDIEIWDLDTVDCMYPNAILGRGADEDGKAKKKKRKKSKKPNESYHVDAVLSLAANKQHRNLLASSSADATVKLWDLHTTKCAKSYDQLHTDKVCSLAWHLTESTALLSGSYDRTVVASDMRAPGAKVPRWKVESDVETVKWDPHRSEVFYISTENGFVHCYDVRSPPSESGKAKAIWSLQAHDESVSSFDINPIIPGFLVTGSTDKEVKLWNVEANGPSMVVSRNVDVGKVFSAAFAPDQEVGFRLAVAGSKGTVQIWDTSTNAAVRRIFADRLAPTTGEVKERLVGVQDVSSDSESGEDDEEEEGEKGAEDGSDDAMSE